VTFDVTFNIDIEMQHKKLPASLLDYFLWSQTWKSALINLRCVFCFVWLNDVGESTRGSSKVGIGARVLTGQRQWLNGWWTPNQLRETQKTTSFFLSLFTNLCLQRLNLITILSGRCAPNSPRRMNHCSGSGWDRPAAGSKSSQWLRTGMHLRANRSQQSSPPHYQRK